MSSSSCRIEFCNVYFSYEDRTVLDGVSFCVLRGEMKVILGGSGSGKSTVLKLAIGLTKPDRGQILFDGQDITGLDEPQLNEIRRRVGMVFQEGALFNSLTVYENIAFRPRELKWSEEKIDREVKRVLGFVGLLNEAEKLPDELSGGMRRRVAIARAIVDRPDIILFDEPTAGLDPPTARSICELMIKLRDLEGVTSMVVTHRLDDVRFLSSKCIAPAWGDEAELRSEDDQLCQANTKFIMLLDGRVIFNGTDEQLWASDDPYIRSFIMDENLTS